MCVCLGYVGMEQYGKKSREKRRRFCDLWVKESRKVCEVRIQYIERKRKRKNVLSLRSLIRSGFRRKLNGKFWILCQVRELFFQKRGFFINCFLGKVGGRFVDRVWCRWRVLYYEVELFIFFKDNCEWMIINFFVVFIFLGYFRMLGVFWVEFI